MLAIFAAEGDDVPCLQTVCVIGHRAIHLPSLIRMARVPLQPLKPQHPSPQFLQQLPLLQQSQPVTSLPVSCRRRAAPAPARLPKKAARTCGRQWPPVPKAG
jgi:hypothetical protein